jgi:NADPH:quinone reductase
MDYCARDPGRREMNASMRAIVVDRFGSAEELRERIVTMPVLGPSQILVQVHAAGVNPVDAQNRRDGAWAGLAVPFVPGSDASGVVVAAGADVRDVVTGDEVFYFSDFLGTRDGAYAEYQAVEASMVAHKPRTLSHAEAAAIPLAAGTAYELVVRRLAVGPGERLLVVGAAGGVGAFAVQLGVLAGAEITAVARREHHAYLRSLGATTLIDYTEQDPFTGGGPVDAIVDLVGGDTIARALEVLAPFRSAATVTRLRGDFDLAIDKNITLHGVLVRPDGARLRALADLADRGKLSVLLRAQFALREASQAHRLIETEHGRGKIVLRLRDEATRSSL